MLLCVVKLCNVRTSRLTLALMTLSRLLASRFISSFSQHGNASGLAVLNASGGSWPNFRADFTFGLRDAIFSPDFRMHHTRCILQQRHGKEVRSGMCEYLNSFYAFWGELGTSFAIRMQKKSPETTEAREECDSPPSGDSQVLSVLI